MTMPTLEQYFGTKELNKKHGPHYTTAYLLYSTRSQDGIPPHKCAAEVAEILELDVNEVKQWASRYDWNGQITEHQRMLRQHS